MKGNEKRLSKDLSLTFMQRLSSEYRQKYFSDMDIIIFNKSCHQQCLTEQKEDIIIFNKSCRQQCATEQKEEQARTSTSGIILKLEEVF
jgi:hypothetical protein